jgi:hypothetical protein
MQATSEHSQTRLNYLRSLFVLVEIIPKILRFLFKRQWTRISGQAWNDNSNEGHRFIAREKQSCSAKQLEKQIFLVTPYLEQVESGITDNWDLTLLCMILLHSRYLKFSFDLHLPIKNLRDQRNKLVAHKASVNVSDAELDKLMNEAQSFVNQVAPSCTLEAELKKLFESVHAAVDYEAQYHAIQMQLNMKNLWHLFQALRERAAHCISDGCIPSLQSALSEAETESGCSSESESEDSDCLLAIHMDGDGSKTSQCLLALQRSFEESQWTWCMLLWLAFMECEAIHGDDESDTHEKRVEWKDVCTKLVGAKGDEMKMAAHIQGLVNDELVKIDSICQSKRFVQLALLSMITYWSARSLSLRLNFPLSTSLSLSCSSIA